MKTKICSKCHKRKKSSNFRKGRNGCKDCEKKYKENNKIKIKEYKEEYRKKYKKRLSKQNQIYYQKHKEKIDKQHKKYLKLNPWYRSYICAKQRCNNPNNTAYNYYGGRGIKFLMTTQDFKYLWFRDKAFLLKQPSIDRIDSDKNYTLKNCRFIELLENVNKGLKGGLNHV